MEQDTRRPMTPETTCKFRRQNPSPGQSRRVDSGLVWCDPRIGRPSFLHTTLGLGWRSQAQALGTRFSRLCDNPISFSGPVVSLAMQTPTVSNSAGGLLLVKPKKGKLPLLLKSGHLFRLHLPYRAWSDSAYFWKPTALALTGSKTCYLRHLRGYHRNVRASDQVIDKSLSLNISKSFTMPKTRSQTRILTRITPKPPSN